MHRTLNARTSLPVLGEFSSFRRRWKGKTPVVVVVVIRMEDRNLLSDVVGKYGARKVASENRSNDARNEKLAAGDIYILASNVSVENFLVFLRVHRDNSRTIDRVARPE